MVFRGVVSAGSEKPSASRFDLSLVLTRLPRSLSSSACCWLQSARVRGSGA
jgi:hypothetical protein